jgi:hypothetical protein
MFLSFDRFANLPTATKASDSSKKLGFACPQTIRVAPLFAGPQRTWQSLPGAEARSNP